ncbi:hypothetical protein NEUTE1DRAFT_116463, partial [Neurospora tetrasperma FGSC 2508]
MRLVLGWRWLLKGKVFNQNWMWRSLDAWVGMKTVRHQRKTRPIVIGIIDHGNEEWRKHIALAQLNDGACFIRRLIAMFNAKSPGN